MSKKEAFEMHSAFRACVKFLCDNFTVNGLYNLFFERGTDGSATGSQLAEFNLDGDGPANFLKALRQLSSKQPGEMGGRLEHVILATMLQAEIHVHNPRGHIEGHHDSTLRVSEEAVFITTPAGMKRGVCKREVHLIHRDPALHYDTILGASEILFKTDDDRDPTKILERAKKFVTDLAAANSETVLRETFGADFDAERHRPISMKAPGEASSAIDLTGGESPSRSRRRPSSNRASLETSMAALQLQVATLAEKIGMLVNGPLRPGASSGPGGSNDDGSESGGSGPGSDRSGSGPGSSDPGSGSSGSSSGGSSSGGSGSGGSGPGSSHSDGSGSSASGAGNGAGSSGAEGSGLRGGGASDPTAASKDKQAMRDALRSLLTRTSGDDLLTEAFLGIKPSGRLCNAEPEARQALVGALVDEIGAGLDEAIDSIQANRTRTANVWLGRLGNYVTVQERLSLMQKRALLELGVPLLQSINPKFVLDATSLSHAASGVTDATARAILSSSAGSQ
jgi:hypothetical protein